LEWFRSYIKKASRPPSYIMERISFLEHSMDCVSAREAQKVISKVIDQLESHKDDEYVDALKMARSRVLDSQQDANRMISTVINKMKYDLSIEERKKKLPWKK